MSLAFWLRRFGAFPVGTLLEPEEGFPSLWLRELPTPGGPVWTLTEEGRRALRAPRLSLTGEGLALRATAALVHELASRYGETPLPLRGSPKGAAWTLGGITVLFSASRYPPKLSPPYPLVAFSQKKPKAKGLLTWVPLEPGGYQHLAQVLNLHLQGH